MTLALLLRSTLDGAAPAPPDSVDSNGLTLLLGRNLTTAAPVGDGVDSTGFLLLLGRNLAAPGVTQVGGGWDSSKRRRRRIVVEINGRALWFETVEEAQAAVNRIVEDIPQSEPPPKVKIRVKPPVKREPDAPRVEVDAAPIDVSALNEWVARWREMARVEWQRRQYDEARRAQEDEEDDEEALLLLL